MPAADWEAAMVPGATHALPKASGRATLSAVEEAQVTDHRQAENDSEQGANKVRVSRAPLLSWLWPVPVGIILGIPLFAPFAKGPSQLSVGGGFGGLLGLAIALVLRALSARRPKSAG